MLDKEARRPVLIHHLGAVVAHLPASGRTRGDTRQHVARIQPARLAVAHGLGHARHAARDGDLIGHLGVLAAARAAGERDALAHGLKQRTAGLKIRLVAAHHNAQGRVARPAVAAADGRIQRLQPPRLRLGRDALPKGGAGGGHVDKVRAGPGVVKDAALPKIDLLHIPGEAHDGDDRILLLRACARALRPRRSLGDQAVRLAFGAVVHRQRMPAAHQMPRHALAHHPDADKADVHMDSLLRFLRCVYHTTARHDGQAEAGAKTPVFRTMFQKHGETCLPWRG